MKAKAALTILALTAAGAFTWSWCRPVDFVDEALAKYGLITEFPMFLVEKIKSEKIKQYEVAEITGGHAGIVFQATVIPGAADSFNQYSNQRLFQMQSHFNRGASPYPGTVSQHTECPADFLPVTQDVKGEGWTGVLVRTFANSRKLFGVCDINERHFEVAQLILLCAGNGTVFDLTIFAPSGEKQVLEQLPAVKCGN